ncbi:hypothetical protein BH11ACT2_BH11ACT2_00750 [soil metagenome]
MKKVAMAAALAVAVALLPTSAQAFTAAPARDRAAIARYYGDPGTGVASRTDSPYIRAVSRIIARELPSVERACAQPHAALVLDVDDTTLATYDLYVGRMHYVNDTALRRAWVRHEKFAAVPGMVRLAKAAKRSGCRLIAITGRASFERTATLGNLANLGYPAFARAYFSTPGSGLSAQQYKTAARARLARAGVVIVANIGDQKSDLAGGHAARDIRLPNRMYTIP